MHNALLVAVLQAHSPVSGQAHLSPSRGQPELMCIRFPKAESVRGGGHGEARHEGFASPSPLFFYLKHGVFATWLYMVTQISTKMTGIPTKVTSIPTKMAPWRRDKNLCRHDRQTMRHSCSHVCGHQQ